MRARFLLALMPLAACALVKPPGPTSVLPHVEDQWRSLATDDDRERLRDWRDSFVAALDSAKKGGRGADIAREGALLDPDAAQSDAALPAGDYRCRWVKLAGEDPRQPRYLGYTPQPCRVGAAGKAMTFEVLAGPQRPVGRILPETYNRMVFLGTLQIGDERGTIRYGDDKQRDMAGFVERIGDRRWRIILPEPHFESQMDVIELVPAG
ncbi:MAG: DUF4893 domain-containing protein [Alphaproteobacteria bacterium]|nr:DUF4893 domain-containing protein [Alphaproteobacteria bacterium]